MTRKEWVEQHYPPNVNDNFIGGILGCPYKYPELCKLDPKIKETMICPGIRRGSGSGVAKCDECWNTPLPDKGVRPSDKVEIRKTMGEPHIKDVFYTMIPQQPNDEIPMPVLGGQFWTFVPLNISQNADLFVMGNFVITALIQDDTIIKVVAKDKILNQTCIFFYNPEKKCIQKLPSDGLLEQKYPEIDFTIYWDEESMNRARRGIISDHEYTNQYILLKKG